jgi:hypothetical protein
MQTVSKQQICKHALLENAVIEERGYAIRF